MRSDRDHPGARPRLDINRGHGGPDAASAVAAAPRSRRQRRSLQRHDLPIPIATSSSGRPQALRPSRAANTRLLLHLAHALRVDPDQQQHA
jgi:hypothetical protein